MKLTPESLPELVLAAKKKEAREQIDRENADRGALHALLSSEKPKTRKNAARLLGALAQKSDAQALTEALRKENTLFVIPSLLLALGSVGGEAARAALLAYTPPTAQDETEDKHVREIGDALEKARATFSDTPLKRYALSAPRPLLAAAPEGFSDLLAKELSDLGFAAQITPAGCIVETADWAALYKTRCMTELLIPIGQNLPLEPAAIAAVARPELTSPYRIELRDYALDRVEFLKRLKAATGGENNPARYALELRIVCHDGCCDLYLKPSYDERRRYPWRKKTISASMKPALGACLARYVAPLVDNPYVLDPFCGSGTLLFSCEEAFPCRELLGVDITQAAVLASRENARAGKSQARFVQKDMRAFVPREKADLVIANLPFGNRVGTHENNRALYAALLNKLPELLDANGVALLYTMEYRLLNDCIRKNGGFRLKDARRTEAGGLLPWVFLLTFSDDGKAGKAKAAPLNG